VTYYDILGVSGTASKDDIKKAYRKLAQDYHPDRLSGVPPAVAKLAEEKFKDVQEAYEILTKHRAEYDNQLQAVAPPPPSPPPSQPRAQTAASGTPPNPPARSASKKKRNIWYIFGKLAGELPWQAWVVLGVVCIYIVAAIADSSNTPATPKQPSSTTVVAQAEATDLLAHPDEAIHPELPRYDEKGNQLIPKAVVVPRVKPDARSGDKRIILGYDYTYNGEYWIKGERAQSPAGEQKSANNKATTPVPIEPSTKFTGQFGGIVHNQSANISAEFGIVVQDAGGILSGCMVVKQPLFGSGPLSGRATGADVSFVVTSAIGKITFAGQSRENAISGTYRVEHERSPTELGTFTLGKLKSEGTVSEFGYPRCPTDEEVHQQDTTNASVTPTPIPAPASTNTRETPSDIGMSLTDRVVVYYADDWQQVRSTCLLLTGRGPASTDPSRQDLSHEQMLCGHIAGNYSNWKLAQNFTARIALDDAAMQAFNTKSRWSVPLFCADQLEANGDLHCTGQVKNSPKPAPEETAPTPAPKYVALGRINCYANQRVVLYTDETLAKVFEQLSPGQEIYVVGTMGESVGATFQKYYAYDSTKPAYWLDGKEIGKLTCAK
jgi:hypothetical protein